LDNPMPDFIPEPDGNFSVWVSQFASQAADWYAKQGVDNPLSVDCLRYLQAWQEAYALHVAAQAAARGATQSKDEARADLEACVRPLAAMLQTDPAMTNAQREVLGVTVRRAGGGRSPAPATAPLVHVNAAERLTHTLRVSDEATPTRMRRPKGTIGAEVRLQLLAPGESPDGNPLAMQYVTIATDGSAMTTFTSEHAGKTAAYVLRWIGAKGVPGPWGPVVMATVAA
jgi:hypothetical protein